MCGYWVDEDALSEELDQKVALARLSNPASQDFLLNKIENNPASQDFQSGFRSRQA
jgi:hypothetical protein